MKHLKKIFACSAIALTMQGCGNEATSSKSADSVTEQVQSKQTQSTSLPMEKYQLSNGLEVVLHQDKSDPVVALAIQYHVGSNRVK